MTFLKKVDLIQRKREGVPHSSPDGSSAFSFRNNIFMR
jgi:hypothetical protein